MDDDAQKNGFVRNMRDKISSGVKPGFLGGEGGGEAPSGSKAEKRAAERSAANSAATDSLKDAEGAASEGVSQREDNLDAARADEQAGGGGFWRGEKINKALEANKEFHKGNFIGAFKKGGPVLGIFFVLFIVGGVIAGTQTFQPFSLIAQFQESFNSMHTSMNTRSNRLLYRQMETGRVKNPIKGTIFGSTFKITNKQKTELAKQGIEVIDDFELPDGSKQKVMKFDDGSGEIKIATARGVDETSWSDVNTKETFRLMSFDRLYATNSSFHHAYNSGSQTWRGQFAGWFGDVTNKFLSNNKLTRNMWKDFKKKKEEALAKGQKVIDVVKEELGKRTGTVEGGGVKRLEGYAEDDNGIIEDEEGNPIRNNEEEKGSTFKRGDVGAVIDKLNSIKSKMQGGASIGCAIVDFIGVVNLMVAGSEALQIINLATSYMEAVDKTKSGYGDEAPINELANTLNERATASHEIIVSTGDGQGDTVDFKSETTKATTKTAMESAGMAGLYGNGYVDPHDSSVQSFNLMSSTNIMLRGVGMGMDSFRSCAIAKGVTAVGSIAVDIVGCLVTLGVGCAADLIKDTVVGVGLAIGIEAVLTGVITALTPWLTSTMTRDLVSTLAGEDLGNALASGANMYQGSVHKANGGSLSTRDKYEQFAIAQQQVVAEEAKEERENLSPFDITSKNTFMGSLMSQLVNFSTSNSLMSTLTSASTVMNSSLVALTPSTSAIASQIAESLPTEAEYEQTCPYLASIGAIGDSFCNPYMVTDMDTMNEDPVDVINFLYDNNQLGFVDSNGVLIAKDDININNYAIPKYLKAESSIKLADSSEEEDVENVVINKNSDLAKYIKYCGERTSAFGVADQSIVEEIDPTDTGNGSANAIIGAIPIVGDISDIMSSTYTLKNIGYISGESCVAGNDLYLDTFAEDSPKWDVAREYQRFIEDQSWAESVGLVEKSAVGVYLEDYYEENPLDNSYEGMLARYSGLDKETISDMLDIIAYYNYINKYDASERYAFSAPMTEESEKILNLENEYVMDGASVALEGVVYADVRNRAFVV